MRDIQEQNMVAIYQRCSTVDQHPESQGIAIAEYCIRVGIPPTQCKIYEDRVSGLCDNRVYLNQMLEDIKKGIIKKVIIWKLDRLGRSLPHLIKLIETFRTSGVEFISITDNFDTTTASGRLQFQTNAAYAEFGASLTSERMLLSIKRRRALGLPVGKQPGAVDKKPRKKDGYFRREERKRMEKVNALFNLLGNKVNLKQLQKKINWAKANDTK